MILVYSILIIYCNILLVFLYKFTNQHIYLFNKIAKMLVMSLQLDSIIVLNLSKKLFFNYILTVYCNDLHPKYFRGFFHKMALEAFSFKINNHQKFFLQISCYWELYRILIMEKRIQFPGRLQKIQFFAERFWENRMEKCQIWCSINLRLKFNKFSLITKN